MTTNRQVAETILPALLDLSEMKMNGRLAYIVSKNTKKARELVKDLNDIREREIKKYASVNQDGTPKIALYDTSTGRAVSDYEPGDPVPEGHYVGYAFDSDELKDEADRVLSDLFDREAEIDWHRIYASDLYALPGISPKVLEQLDGTILFEGEDED
jgi:hypothetical protein